MGALWPSMHSHRQAKNHEITVCIIDISYFCSISCAAFRESEALEKKLEDTVILREEEAYRRTIGVGRYELTLDIMEEDLENTREKLAEVCLTRTTQTIPAKVMHRQNITIFCSKSVAGNNASRGRKCA